MTACGYARVSRGRNNGTVALSDQWIRLAYDGVDASHIR